MFDFKNTVPAKQRSKRRRRRRRHVQWRSVIRGQVSYLRNGQVGVRHEEGDTADHGLDEAVEHHVLEQAVGDHDAAPGLPDQRAHHCKHQASWSALQ